MKNADTDLRRLVWHGYTATMFPAALGLPMVGLAQLDLVVILIQILAFCCILSGCYGLYCFGRVALGGRLPLTLISVPGALIALVVILFNAYGLNGAFRAWVNEVLY